MTIEYAYRLFGLTPGNSTQEIAERYRRLVRQYHPDANSAKQEIAHIMMTKINEAYDLIQNHINSQPTDPSHSTDSDHRETPHPNSTAEPKIPEEEWLRGAIPESPLQLRQIDREIIVECIDIICYYYQFNLYNIPMRSQGSGRLHYSSVCSRLQRLIAMTRKHAFTTESDVNYFEDLAALFYENIKIDLFMQPSVGKEAYKEFRKYSVGNQAADQVLLAWYCYDLVGRRAPYFDIHNYDVSYTVFSVLLETRGNRAINEASEIKLALLEQFIHTRYFEFQE